VRLGRGGNVSCCLLVTHDGCKLVEGFIHGSGGLCLLIEPLLHLLEPFICCLWQESQQLSMTVMEGEHGVVGCNQGSFTSDHLYYSPILTSVLGRESSTVRATLLF
jgi:hypothetical protein